MRGALVGLMLAMVGGCHLVFPISADDTSRGDGGPGGDGALAGWSTPVPIVVSGHPESGTKYITDPGLSGDEQVLVFSEWDTTTPDSGQVWYAGNGGDPHLWASPVFLPFNDSTRGDANPKITDDYLRIWYAWYGDPSLTDVDIRVFERGGGTSTSWTEVTAVQANILNTPEADRPGTPTAAQDRIIVHHRAGTDPQRMIEYVRIPPATNWAPAPGDPMAEVNALGSVYNGHMVDDGRLLVFAAERPGGNSDLYVARRTAVGTTFGSIERLDALSTDAEETDPWLSADGRRIWFARREGGLLVSEWGIYYSSR